MEIGLMRHYPVDYRFDRWSDSSTFDRDMDRYDAAAVKIPETKSDVAGWDVCYCSTMSRAAKTAEIILGKNTIRTDLLIEVPLKSGFHTRLKFPLAFWAFIGRIQWWCNGRSQPESRKKTLARALTFYQHFCLPHGNHSRILLITHGFFMVFLRKILKKNGFSGPFFLKPGNGVIYIFSNSPRKNG